MIYYASINILYESIVFRCMCDQTYVCHLRSTASNGQPREFSLLFIASSADAEEFKSIHCERLLFEEV